MIEEGLMDEKGFIQRAGQIERDVIAFNGRHVYDYELFSP